MNLIAKILKRVTINEETGCWEVACKGKRHRYYNANVAKGKTVYGHRVMLEHKLGRTLQPGSFACHTCDTPCCVNPQHLYEGSPKTNAQDMVQRGRCKTPLGSAHWSAKPFAINDTEFTTLAEAARTLNVSRGIIFYNLKRGKAGYRYL